MTIKLKPKAGVSWIREVSQHLGKVQPSFPDKADKILLLSPSQIGTFAVMDVESTDISIIPVQITELAVRKYLYNRETFEVLSETESYTSFNEPDDLSSITEHISLITGITAQDVIGHKIDWDYVNKFVADCDYFVAHNAGFDKPLIAPHLTGTKAKWLCSLNWVNWADKFNCPIKSQEVLILQICHWEYSGHRAMNDVSALGQLVEKADILGDMVGVANKATIQVFGYLDPFGKDMVKKMLMADSSPLGFALELKSKFDAEVNKKVYWYEAINITISEGESAKQKIIDLVNSNYSGYGDKLVIKVKGTEI